MNTDRFTKIGADGAPLPADAADWVAVLDDAANLLWSASDVADAVLDHGDADQAIAALNESKLAGFDDWDMPTVEELFCLADRSRTSPTIDTDFFPACKSDWYWSKTPYASYSGFARFVDFGNGNASRCLRDYKCRVRAVRRVRAPSQ